MCVTHCNDSRVCRGSENNAFGARAGTALRLKRSGKRRNKGAVEVATPWQEKLQALFAALQLPCLSRVNFMHKYSNPSHAKGITSCCCITTAASARRHHHHDAVMETDMAVAVDIWSEIAVLVLFKIEVGKMIKKLQQGYCVMPLHHRTLFACVEAELPAVLKAKEAKYVPKFSSDEHSESHHLDHHHSDASAAPEGEQVNL